MERILADTTATGAITAYYLHGPDLAVKVDATDPAKITCYHADASGNIVRLTDKDRVSIAQYAYSDYGRPFVTAAAGQADTNPYRFVGSQGVMEEPLIPGLYFMRARYYLADAGVFLSVDPVKNIGAGWRPEAYGYSGSNPNRYNDPEGTSFTESVIKFGAEANRAKSFMNNGFAVAVIYANPFSAYHFVQGFAAGGLKAFFYEQTPYGVAAEEFIDAGENVLDIVDLPKRGLKKFLSKKVTEAPYSSGEDAGGYAYEKFREFTDTSGIYFNNVGKSISSYLTQPSKSSSAIPAANHAQQSNSKNSTSPVSVSRASFTTSSISNYSGSTYTIKSGDTLSAISARTGVSIAELAAANRISNVDSIKAGANLSIPSNGGGSSGTASKPGTSTGSKGGTPTSSKGK